MRKYLKKLLFLVLIFLFSCEKIIDIPLKYVDSKLVIEGNIDNYNNSQEVIISRSTSFSYSGERVPVSGAKVYINEDGEESNLLVEDVKGIYRLKNFKGTPGKTYCLTVQVDGVEYRSQSTMPLPVSIDSVGTVEAYLPSGSTKSARIVYTDPEETKNYYRFKLEVNGEFGKSIWISDDRFNNGKVIDRTLLDFDKKLKKDDEMKVYMHSIDSNMYSYWNAVLSQNPGSSTPSNPKSNISDNILGYFSAHSIEAASFQVN